MLSLCSYLHSMFVKKQASQPDQYMSRQIRILAMTTCAIPLFVMSRSFSLNFKVSFFGNNVVLKYTFSVYLRWTRSKCKTSRFRILNSYSTLSLNLQKPSIELGWCINIHQMIAPISALLVVIKALLSDSVKPWVIDRTNIAAGKSNSACF